MEGENVLTREVRQVTFSENKAETIQHQEPPLTNKARTFKISKLVLREKTNIAGGNSIQRGDSSLKIRI